MTRCEKVSLAPAKVNADQKNFNGGRAGGPRNGEPGRLARPAGELDFQTGRRDGFYRRFLPSLFQAGRGGLQPFAIRLGIRAEGFQAAFAVVVIERAVQAEGRGVGRVNQAGGVSSAHLEDDAHFKFSSASSARETGLHYYRYRR